MCRCELKDEKGCRRCSPPRMFKTVKINSIVKKINAEEDVDSIVWM